MSALPIDPGGDRCEHFRVCHSYPPHFDMYTQVLDRSNPDLRNFYVVGAAGGLLRASPQRLPVTMLVSCELVDRKQWPSGGAEGLVSRLPQEPMQHNQFPELEAPPMVPWLVMFRFFAEMVSGHKIGERLPT